MTTIGNLYQKKQKHERENHHLTHLRNIRKLRKRSPRPHSHYSNSKPASQGTSPVIGQSRTVPEEYPQTKKRSPTPPPSEKTTATPGPYSSKPASPEKQKYNDYIAHTEEMENNVFEYDKHGPPVHTNRKKTLNLTTIKNDDEREAVVKSIIFRYEGYDEYLRKKGFRTNNFKLRRLNNDLASRKTRFIEYIKSKQPKKKSASPKKKSPPPKKKSPPPVDEECGPNANWRRKLQDDFFCVRYH